MNWGRQLDEFGHSLVSALGYDPNWLPGDHNPITRALRDQPCTDWTDVSLQSGRIKRKCHNGFLSTAQKLAGYSLSAMSRVATVCQMVVFDHQGGPEGDGKPKALRRHWYSWVKTHFAQPLSEQLGEDLQSERWGLNWSGRLSQTYAGFVDNGGDITYRDLWVEDASRMMAQNWETLFNGCHIIVAVEKDSLFADFEAPAKALGARSVYSGKGKSSKAAIEKVLREHFDWGNDCNPFSPDEPLIILHISDHDFDGEAVIGPTFGEQSRRYTDCIFEARVGIRPETVTELGHDPTKKWYQVKVSNKGYERWAEEKALFLDEWGEAVQGKMDFDKDVDIAHGYEVEALRTRDYYKLLVDALLSVLPFSYIVSRLRDECTASADDAARRLTTKICEVNKDYQEILAEFERLEILKTDFEEAAREQLQELGDPHIHDWRDDDDDPEPEDFQRYVEKATDWSSPWRPFNRMNRTDSLVEWLRDTAADVIEGLKDQAIL